MQIYRLKMFKYVVGLSVSIACLFYLLQKIDMHIVFDLFKSMNYTWFVMATIIGISKMWWTGLRWRYLATFCNQLKKSDSFYFYTIGTMLNMLLPLRSGDLLRIRLISKKLQVSTFKILATVTSEHMLDFLVLIIFLISCLFFYSYHLPKHVLATMVTLSSVMMIFTGSVFLLKRIPEIYFFKKMIANFHTGFFQFEKHKFKVMMLTILIWLAQSLWIYALLRCLGMTMHYHLGVEAIFVIVVMMGAAAMLPATPGYIGTFHLMVVLGLTQIGVPKSVALSYAILAHAHSVVWAIIVGLFSLWRINKDIAPFSRELITINELTS